VSSAEAFGFGEDFFEVLVGAFGEGFEDFVEVLGFGDSFGVSSVVSKAVKFLGTLRHLKNFWISP
tara:strand:+ start:127 stop:321 length:195 start_codon:yes stop_codon:yes gene_type:complete